MDGNALQFDLYIFGVDWTLVCPIEGAGRDKVFRKGAADWQFLPGRCEHVLALREAGAKIALASNQGGVGFGLYGTYPTGETAMENEIIRVAEAVGADSYYVCYTHPKANLERYRVAEDIDRKPNPGMILSALRDCKVRAGQAVMIGDSEDDEGAARAAGVAFIHADVFFGADGEEGKDA